MAETTVAEIDDKGRIRLPRAVIRALDAKPGDLIRVTVEKVKTAAKSESGNPLKAPTPASA